MVNKRCRIVHVVYRFAIGGLENVIVQLINRLPVNEFEHIILSLTSISDFKDRITLPDVHFIALNKAPGHAIPLYPRIYKLLRELKPDVLHTCNLAALEVVPLGWLARIPFRVHAEHGWDAHDPDGTNPRYCRLRKLYKPFVSHYVSVSEDIDQYLANKIHVPASHRTLIANGVDTDLFAPSVEEVRTIAGCPFTPNEHWLIGTVGRLQTVKNQPLLARAFVKLLQKYPEAEKRIRLLIIGEGALREEIEQILGSAGFRHLAWLPGARDDIADILKSLDCFVLPSQAEGTSCTLQEAMACGLPVVATAVGGTPALVDEGVTGYLVPPNDETTMADAIWDHYSHTDRAIKQGQMGREKVLKKYTLTGAINCYRTLFSQHHM